MREVSAACAYEFDDFERAGRQATLAEMILTALINGVVAAVSGRLNPILDTSNRTYLYADNIAIEEGRQQPVHFRLGKPLRLTDAFGYELSVTIVDIVGSSALLEYRPIEPQDSGANAKLGINPEIDS